DSFVPCCSLAWLRASLRSGPRNTACSRGFCAAGLRRGGRPAKVCRACRCGRSFQRLPHHLDLLRVFVAPLLPAFVVEIPFDPLTNVGLRGKRFLALLASVANDSFVARRVREKAVEMLAAKEQPAPNLPAVRVATT